MKTWQSFPSNGKVYRLPKEGFVRAKDRVNERVTVTPVQLQCGFDFHFPCDFFLILFFIYVFIYLSVLGLSGSMWDIELWHVNL